MEYRWPPAVAPNDSPRCGSCRALLLRTSTSHRPPHTFSLKSARGAGAALPKHAEHVGRPVIGEANSSSRAAEQGYARRIMTLTVAVAFNDAVLLCADQRRSMPVSGVFVSNNRKIHLFGARAGLMVAGLAAITGAVIAKLRETVGDDVDVDVLAAAALEVGAPLYEQLVVDARRHNDGYDKAEFTVAGFDRNGQPSIRYVGLHDGRCAEHGIGQMSIGGDAEADLVIADANAVLGNVGPVFADEFAHYVIGRSALRAPSKIGLPVDVVLLTHSGTFQRTMPEAELAYVLPMFQLVPVGSGFAHAPLVVASLGNLQPRATALRGRPLSG